MQDSCLYHPSITGEWDCLNCEASFCGECAIWKHSGRPRQKPRPYCPHCNNPLQWVGAANLLPPFWERLHRFFVYPLHRRPLILILAVSAAVFLLQSAPLLLGPFLGFLARIFAYLICLRYAYEILKTTARGDLYPPPLDNETLLRDITPVLKLFFLFLLLFSAGSFLAQAAAPLLLFYILFLLLFWPAILIMLVTTESPIKALNPFLFVPLAWRIGPAYLLMYFFLLLLSVAPGALHQQVVVHLPSLVQPFLAVAAEYYYMFVSFHLIGYVLLQYHLEIGYQVRYENFRAPEIRERRESTPDSSGNWNWESYADSLLQSGQFQEAMDYLGRCFDSADEPDLALCRKYFGLLRMRGECSELTRVGYRLIPLLLQSSLRKEARQAYEACVQCDSSFLPDSGSLFRLAEALEDAGESERAMQLYQRLYKKDPRHERAVEAVFRIGYILNERMLAPERAKRVLQGLISRHPEHSLRPRIESYLSHSVPSS